MYARCCCVDVVLYRCVWLCMLYACCVHREPLQTGWFWGGCGGALLGGWCGVFGEFLVFMLWGEYTRQTVAQWWKRRSKQEWKKYHLCNGSTPFSKSQRASHESAFIYVGTLYYAVIHIRQKLCNRFGLLPQSWSINVAMATNSQIFCSCLVSSVIYYRTPTGNRWMIYYRSTTTNRLPALWLYTIFMSTTFGEPRSLSTLFACYVLIIIKVIEMIWNSVHEWNVQRANWSQREHRDRVIYVGAICGGCTEMALIQFTHFCSVGAGGR